MASSHHSHTLNALAPIPTQSINLGLQGNEWPYSRPATPLLHHTPKIGFIGLGSLGESGLPALRRAYLIVRFLSNRILHG